MNATKEKIVSTYPRFYIDRKQIMKLCRCQAIRCRLSPESSFSVKKKKEKEEEEGEGGREEAGGGKRKKKEEKKKE